MARLFIGAALAAALLLPTHAIAAPHRSGHSHAAKRSKRHRVSRRRSPAQPAGADPVALATQVAKRYWAAQPCGGEVAVMAYSPLAPGVDSQTDGWVTFNSSLGPNDLEAPASTYSQCEIWLARWHWPTPRAADEDWNMFCLTVIHEMGHLLGYKHSSVPGSVMAPVFTDESSVPTICRSTAPSAARSR
jgi:hypothetical protein